MVKTPPKNDKYSRMARGLCSVPLSPSCSEVNAVVSDQNNNLSRSVKAKNGVRKSCLENTETVSSKINLFEKISKVVATKSGEIDQL